MTKNCWWESRKLLFKKRLVAVIQSCLVANPFERITFEEIAEIFSFSFFKQHNRLKNEVNDLEDENKMLRKKVELLEKHSVFAEEADKDLAKTMTKLKVANDPVVQALDCIRKLDFINSLEGKVREEEAFILVAKFRRYIFGKEAAEMKMEIQRVGC